MSLLKPFRTVIPVANNDTSTYYVSMQPVICGKSTSKFVSPKLTFKSSTNEFLLNNSTIGAKNTASGTKPINPNVGDIWYDTSTDIQFQYIFDGRNYFWIESSGVITGGTQITVPIPDTSPIQINYLIVGGGGGGGVSGATPPADTAATGGGGGGGGVITGVLNAPFTYTGNLITMTVGTGGNGGNATCPSPIPSRAGTTGNDSTLATPLITPQIAKGGGGGGGGQRGAPGTGPSCTGAPGKPGGSGGGSFAPGVSTPFFSNQAGQALNFPGPLAQGTTGGTGCYVYGGGGGGASSNTGTNGTAPKGGNGGAGYTWIYNSLTYGGGGGGGGGFGDGNNGSGGPGGGGAGNPTTCGVGSLRGVPGTHGTGGGGGGSAGGSPPQRAVGGNGAPGAIILSIPTTRFTGNSQGAFSVTSNIVGGYIVLEYRGSAGSPNVFSYIV
jgi:hypothetical protein